MSGKADPVNPEKRWLEIMEEIKKDAKKDMKELQSNRANLSRNRETNLSRSRESSAF
jgi:hypothetical protein